MMCGQIKERRTVKQGGGIEAEELRTFLHDTEQTTVMDARRHY